MELVTHQVNVLRGEAPPAKNAVKTHCKNEHEFTPENTIKQRSGRQCRACTYESSRRYRKRQRG